MYVVTTKPKTYADRIIKHFGFDEWLEGVYGTGLDGTFDNKADLIKHILGELKLSGEATVMIGDRREDVLAGKTNGTKTIGVTYGFGSSKEILDSLPDYICGDPADLQGTVLKIHHAYI